MWASTQLMSLSTL